jgi:hypothetical protein
MYNSGVIKNQRSAKICTLEKFYGLINDGNMLLVLEGDW